MDARDNCEELFAEQSDVEVDVTETLEFPGETVENPSEAVEVVTDDEMTNQDEFVDVSLNESRDIIVQKAELVIEECKTPVAHESDVARDLYADVEDIKAQDDILADIVDEFEQEKTEEAQDQEYWSNLLAKKQDEHIEEKTNLYAQLEKLQQEFDVVNGESIEKDKKVISLQSQVEQKEKLLDFFYKEQENQRVEIVIFRHKAKELEEKLQHSHFENEKLRQEITKQKSQLDKFSLFQSNNDEFQDVQAPMSKSRLQVQPLALNTVVQNTTTPKKESTFDKLKSLVSPRSNRKSTAGIKPFLSVSEDNQTVTSPRKMKEESKRKHVESATQSPKKRKVDE